MTNNIVCPICGKNGIPDYHKKDVVCPCCGSDLSIYRVVDGIPDGKSKTYWIAGAIASCCAAIVLASILIFHKPNVSASDDMLVWRDSVELLKEQISIICAEENTEDIGFQYVVRKGDSFWKISQRMYGTGTKASAVAEMNHMSLQDVLNVGDTLIIK